MGFQILDKDGNAIIINDLDKEACDFWKQEYDPKFYASPKEMWGNWFDVIGYKIHNPIDPNYTKGWGNVKHNMLLVSVGGLYQQVGNIHELHTKISGVNNYLLPYFQLIDHWESKGYQPKKVID